MPKKSNRGLATFDKSNYFPVTFLETRNELLNDIDSPGYQKELAVPKIATHALGLEEDNAADQNEGEQGEDDENRENGNEFEIPVGGHQNVEHSLNVDGIPEGRRTMLPGGNMLAQIRNTVNDLQDEENPIPVFRSA